MDNPMRRTLFTLSYIRGPKVDDWVDVMHRWIETQHAATGTPQGHVQIPSNDERYWTEFTTEFNRVFSDTTEKQNAGIKLHGLKMEGGDLDTYLASF